MPDDIREQLVKHLTDVHSIEEQALTQLRRAPGIAGDPRLATAFEQHLEETRRHESLVRERLEALGAEPSTLKDFAGKAGGLGMLAFAELNPDTPGKLASHAFSYEHMEVAAYELLARVADRAGDRDTGELARQICAEEREMAARIEANFDGAVAASLGDRAPGELEEQLNSYLADAHAIEQQSISLLQGAMKLVDDTQLEGLFEEHLAETREQAKLVTERLEGRGSSPSRIKDIGMRLGGLNVGAFFGAQPDTTAKLVGFAFAFEHLEIAGYEQLKRVAGRAGELGVAALATKIAEEEREAAAKLAANWDRAIGAALVEQGVADGHADSPAAVDS
jgi:ferritin-like metal-binding protein YciE